MRRVTVREARRNFRALLDAAEQGEEIWIERRGTPTARLVPMPTSSLESLSDFRASLTPARQSTADVVRALRDEESG